MRIFPGSIFLLAALAFGAGAVHFFHQFADYRLNGLPSVGTVLRVTVYPVNNGGKSSYTRYTDVRFATADGTLLEHSFHDELSGAKEGDQVDLLYKPGNPQDVISASWSTLFFGLVMTLGVLAGLLAFSSFTPLKALPEDPPVEP
ncbi:DUF3592 domain-containing protein [Pseudomonas sp. CF161]|uniref:DUF3592 domain-containing protein n=1 Tax=Pseudomonas sp. CF161 TaxID=911241 RepID=UPI0003553AC7|nr:DUF3592 domain-containing protein [Pseudomonas sp. CF161]EPL06224.1 hypothetical protein CF161_19899 [Pseudomonas sp. CF161]